MFTTSTVTRSEEPSPFCQWETEASSTDNTMNGMQHSLSSPLISYKFETTPSAIIVRHNQTYAERLKSSKNQIETLTTRIEALEAADKYNQVILKGLVVAEKRRKEISLEWETRTRIATGLNDSYLKSIPDNLRYCLSIAGYRFLPPILSAWAIKRVGESKETFLITRDIEDEVLDNHVRIWLALEQNGLSQVMDTLWNTLPADGIRLMVNVWLSRPTDRAGIAHPTPTSVEARRIINSDILPLDCRKGHR